MDSQDATSLVRSIVKEIISNLPYHDVIDLTTSLSLNSTVPHEYMLSKIDENFNYLDSDKFHDD